MMRVPTALSYRALLAALSLAAAGCPKRVLPPEAVPAARSDAVATGSAVLLDASGSADPNIPPRPLLYRWSFRSLPPLSRATLNDPGVVNPSFVADVDGEYEVELTVSNGLLSSRPALVKITAGPCGSGVPKVTEVSAFPASPSTGQVAQLSAKYSDPDNETGCGLNQSLSLRWSIAALPPGSNAQLNSAGAANPSFTADKPGEYQVELVVTDSTGRQSAPFTLKLTASGCGDAPPLVEKPSANPPGPNVGQVVTVTTAVSDSDNAPGCDLKQTFSYNWFFVSLPTGSAARLNDAQIENPSFTPDLTGAYVVRVRVTDSSGRTTLSEPTIVSVAACGGAAPIVTGVTASPALPNAGNTVQLTAQVSDADAQPPCSEPQTYSYQWQLLALPAGSTATLNNAQAANPSFKADVPGSYLVRLSVTDLRGNRGPITDLTVTASTCGSASPVAVVQAPASAVPGDLVQAVAFVTDADSSCTGLAPEQFTYQWSFEELPLGSQATLNDALIKGPSFVADVPGSYKLKVVAKDAAGHPSAPAFATVSAGTCGANAPTVALSSTPPSPLNIGQLVTVDAAVTDEDNAAACRAGSGDGGVPDGGVLAGPLQSFTFAWYFESLPAGSQAALNNASVQSPGFTPNVAGQYGLRVKVTDSTGRSTLSGPLLVTVNNCGASAPVVASI
ncbi:MAG: PKD domain-containing protein, partial [Myxococcaceae bacterium]